MLAVGLFNILTICIYDTGSNQGGNGLMLRGWPLTVRSLSALALSVLQLLSYQSSGLFYIGQARNIVILQVSFHFPLASVFSRA